MDSKHLLPVTALTALVLSAVACSSTPQDGGGTGGGGGSLPSSGGMTSAAGHVGSGATGGTGGSLSGSGGSAGKATTGTGGSGGTGASPAGGSGGTLTGSGGTGGGSPAGGSSGSGVTGGTGGTFGTAGASSGGTSGSGTGGTGAGGAPGTGGSASGGMPGSGGSVGTGGGTAVQCDNLSFAPSMTGVARPSGAAGGLKVLDWAGFKGAVSYTFDDNTPSQLQDYSQLKATGAHFTWFVVGSWLNGSSSNISGYKGSLADGMEIASHTYSHQSAGSLSDLQQNETFITQNFGVNANTMAAPNCDASWASVAPNVMFQNRGPCGNPISTVGARDMTSPFQLPAYLPAASGVTASTLTGTYADDKWRIFVIHGFDSQNGTYQPVPIDVVTAAMSSAVTGGYWTEGITDVGAYWQGQNLISASATTNATWTLPAHFPKNMCVRVTTTGGTVTQKGQVIPWDSHGYYQISLDAGEVTVQ
ncbi:MAG TPA: polysaccharide deacetylase family protein [Polyangiaceae bacterium]|nr:polysaccharide deacetylase family protein [Polyangiaceae bacterium]